METTGIVQETYNVWNWLLPLVSGAIGALIGTYGGSYFLHWSEEKKIKNVRSIAVKALDIFKEYSNYADSANEFNTKLSVSEKRAVVVALHKLGVPFETPTRDIFDIKSIRLKDIVVDKDEIMAMIIQIDKGNCDNLFFMDIESYFTANLRLNALRNVGKKYVEEVHAKSWVDKDKPDTIINPKDWHKQFTPGELQMVLVLRTHLANTDYFSVDGHADPNKIKDLIREIEIGLWDNDFFYDYESFMNIRAQHGLANVVQNMITMNQQQVNNSSETKMVERNTDTMTNS
ncbi:MAG: hypothetical protein ACI3Z9_08215 [Candidatus Onthomorpha sp.]